MTSPNADPHIARFLASVPEPLRMAAVSVMAERLSWMRQHGIMFDGTRDLYAAFGWTREVTISSMRQRYARGGIAKRIVNALPKATWRGGLEVIEDDNPKKQTPFEAAWQSLWERLNLRSKFERQDRLSRLGDYGVLLIGVKGTAPIETPLPNGTGPDDVLFVRPLLGSGGPDALTSVMADRTSMMGGTVQAAGVTVDSLVEDPRDARYGQPKFYRLLADGRKVNTSQSLVHWSRCIHICDDPLEDDVYSDPGLLAVWNYLDDLEKMHGGGAEAFFQRANQGRVWNLDKEARPLSDEEKTDFADQIAQLQHGMMRDIRTRGIKVQTLGSDVATFSGDIDGLLTLIAGTVEIPKRILTGSEMGELASSQDRDNWRDQVNGRREAHAWPNMVRALIVRFLDHKYLPEPKNRSVLKPKWGVVMNLTEEEKMTGAKSWAGTSVAGRPVFSDDEIRWQWYEKEPLTPEVKQAIAPAPRVVAAPFGAPRAAADETELPFNTSRAAGGPGSGNFGHAGRPGEVGGSADRDTPVSTPDGATVWYKGMYAYDWTKEVKKGKETADRGPLIAPEDIDRDTPMPTFDPADKEGLDIKGFFSDNADTASYFAEHMNGAVYRVELQADPKRVKTIDAKGEKAGNVQFGPSGKKFRDYVRSGKYDVIVIKNTADEGNIAVALKGATIKNKLVRGMAAQNAVTALADTHTAPLETLCATVFSQFDVPATIDADAIAADLQRAFEQSGLIGVLEDAADAGATHESAAIHALTPTRTLASVVARILKRDKPVPRSYVFGQNEAAAWAEDHAAELITDITDTTRDQIRFIVARFVEKEITEAEYVREIRKAIGDAARATLIARTESMRAVNAGRRAAWRSARKLKVLPRNAKRTWITADDEARCPICAEYDGETTLLTGTYSGGIDGPPAHPRCRCTEGLSL